MLENTIGKRYAVALSDTIPDAALLKSALASLQALRLAFQVDGRLSQFFAHPSIPLTNKSAMIAEMCDRLSVSASVRNLLQMLTQRKKIVFLPQIASHFESVVDNRLNQLRITVESAGPLEADQVEKLKGALHKALGKNILIETRENPALIGGMVLRMGSLVVDATIKNRLALLKQAIEKEEIVK